MKQILSVVLILGFCHLAVDAQVAYKTIDLSGRSLEGRGWNSGLKDNYDRLPARAEQVVRKEVWDLSRNSAGLQFRFRTNAREIKLKYTVTGPKQMNHMPATGVSGVDLYARSGKEQWKWCGARFSFGDTVMYTYSDLNQEDGREYVLYFPLYNHVSWMELSYPDDASFRFEDPVNEKPIVIYGTSIAQGGCASRPGLAWTNILGRKLGKPIVNLAFSGNGRMETEVFRLISEINADMLVIDCLPNMAGDIYLKGELKRRLTEGITFMRSQKPDLPILLVDHCGYTDELTNNQKKNTYQSANRIQRAVFDSLKTAGVKNLYYLTKEEIGLTIESTVDGIHPNDIGMMQYAEAYFRKIGSSQQAAASKDGNPGNAQAKNVLIIYSDDHSYHALGAAGNKEVKTPNIDKLAKEGMIFLQAHVMGGHQGAVCIPSRVMLLTGRYVNRLPRDGGVIPDSITSLPEVLRSRGYTTYHTGKWHSDKMSHHRMFSNGGDIFLGGMHFEKDGGQPHPTVYTFDPKGEYPAELKRNADTFSTTLYAENAIRFLNSKSAKERPFFCYVAFTSPHDPRTPPAEFEKMYPPSKIRLPSNYLPVHPFDNGDMKVRDEALLPWPRTEDAVKKEIALYYGMIGEMDKQVGRIIKALEDNGLRENTIVVFAGDNGLAVGQHGLLGKQNLYEHSIRVPMIISGPGVPRGSKYEGFNYLSDIAPTLYDYLGIPAPAIVEGKSLKPVFRDHSVKIRLLLYNVYGHWSRSIKTTDGFKLILYNVDGVAHTQLFNLAKDPWEKNDLSSDPSFADKIRSMRGLLKAEMVATHDDLDIDLPDWGRKAGQKGRGS